MTIDQLETQIRDFINSGRRQSILLQDSSNWNKLCSALDVIGDTTLAILAYPNLCKAVQDAGASYLIIYGILQTLQLQQDAAKKIGDALGIKVELPEQLEDIKIIRHDTAGHPFLRKQNNLSNSSFINRSFLSPVFFELMTTSSDKKECIEHTSITINVPQLIKIQEQYLGEILTKVIIELQNQEMTHKNKHKDIKLVDIFSSLNHSFQKVHEAINHTVSFKLGKSQIQFIKERCDKFKSELLNRNEWDESDNYRYELIDYPMNELEKYFEGTGESKLNDKDAFIFTVFLYKQIEDLRKIAEQIDEDYESIS